VAEPILDPTTTDGAPMRGRRHPLQQGWAILVDGLSAIATAFIAILMLVICADIVARNGLGSSLPLVSELGAMIVVLIVALQLPSAISADRLARVDMVLDVFGEFAPRIASVLNALFCLVGAAILALVAWSSFGIFDDALGSNDFIGIPGIATLPTWPFRAMITIGMTVAALEYLFKALGHFGRAATGERAVS
jgi:TRAP-type C4-dicarboxylate transport system permease small subunit